MSTIALETRPYAEVRRCIDWKRTAHLRVVKALAIAAMEVGYFGRQRIWMEVEESCERVIRAVLGEEGVTFARVRADALAAQGIEITPGKLVARAWNGVFGQDELDELYEDVLEAYAPTYARMGTDD